MSWLAISNVLALFCISFAPAQAEFKPFRQLEHAHVLRYNEIMEESSSLFNSENVFLYRDDSKPDQILFKVVEDNRRFSKEFPIRQRFTVVDKNEILIGYDDEFVKYAITLALKKGVDTFAFYRALFSFEEFPRKFDAIRLTRGGKKHDISTIKAKNGVGREWNVIALNGDKPCLIFPMQRVYSVANKMAEKKVTFTLHQLIEWKTEIVVEFNSSEDANRFYGFLRETWP